MQKEVYHYPTLHFLSDVWIFINPYTVTFIAWSLVRSFASVLELAIPILLGKIIDILTKSQDNTFLIKLVIGVAVIELLGPTIRLKSKYHLGILGTRIAKDIRLKGLAKVLELDLAWHEETMSGAVMQKVSTGADSIKGLIKFLREDGYTILIKITGALVVFGYLHIKYLLLLVAAIVSYLWVEYHWDIIINQQKNRESATREQLFGRTYEFAHNIRTVKALGIESAVKRKAADAEEKLFGISNEVSLVMNRKWRIMQTVVAFFKSLFIIVVCIDVLRGYLSAGMVLVYITYFHQVHGALNNISDSVDGLIENKNGLYRFMTVLDSHSEVDAGKNLRSLSSIESTQFSNVSFRYKEKKVLSGLNFCINKGERIGIVGQSGVGKSTLFKLLLKLYLPTQGDILINSLPIQKIKRDSITKYLTIVPQDTEVFNLSFKDNITLTDTKVNNYRYKRALDISACSDIIKRLSTGDETLIGEKGVRLSGGERQRLGIARALYKDADVILLDEATSHLDSKTEQQIISAMALHLGKKTLIVIAHRLSTLRTMDRILVFSRGRIAEEGTYSDLLASHGLFHRLHKLQATS